MTSVKESYVFVTFVTVDPHDLFQRPTCIEFYRIPLSLFHSVFSESDRIEMYAYCMPDNVYKQWLQFLKEYKTELQTAGDAQDIDMTDVSQSYCLQYIKS